MKYGPRGGLLLSPGRDENRLIFYLVRALEKYARKDYGAEIILRKKLPNLRRIPDIVVKTTPMKIIEVKPDCSMGNVCSAIGQLLVAKLAYPDSELYFHAGNTVVNSVPADIGKILGQFSIKIYELTVYGNLMEMDYARNIGIHYYNSRKDEVFELT